MPWSLGGAWPFLVFLLTIPGALAQPESHEQDQPRYRIDVDAALFELRVTDSEGKPISDLSETDFEVLQDGEPRPIVFFKEFSSRPLSLGILLDVGSGMSVENVRKGKQLIFDLIHALPPEDEVSIGLYCDLRDPPPEWKNGSSKERQVDVLAKLTQDRHSLLRAIENLAIGDRPARIQFLGKTVSLPGTGGPAAAVGADYSPSDSQTGAAVDKTLIKLRKAAHPNRAVLVISAGLPNIGEGTLDHLGRAEAVLFEITFGYKIGDLLDLGFNNRDRKKIIRLTAGASYFAESVASQIECFHDNLKHSYLLAFRPREAREEEADRMVEVGQMMEEVEIRTLAHPEARISAAWRSTRALEDWWRGD